MQVFNVTSVKSKGVSIADVTDALRDLRETAPQTAALTFHPTYLDPPSFEIVAKWPIESPRHFDVLSQEEKTRL